MEKDIQKLMVDLNENVIISIIIPVYNTALYLGECLECILKQTESRFELICVNDGSTDDSLNILSEFQKKDKRVKILNTNHIGAANARNLGLKNACGEYVCFLDSDDIFDENMIKELYHCAEVNEAEIGMCEYDAYESERLSEGKFGNYLERIFLNHADCFCGSCFEMSGLSVEALLILGVNAWNKIYRRQFLIEKNIWFQDLKSANDFSFVVKAFMHAERIVHTNSFEALLHYRRGRSGNTTENRSVIDLYNALKKVYEDVIRFSKEDKKRKQYYVLALYYLTLGFCKNGGEKEENKNFYEYFSKQGLNEIGLLDISKLTGVEEYKIMLQCFQECSYESQWYKRINTISCQLSEKRIAELKWLCETKRVAVWGCGLRGIEFLNVAKNNGLKLRGVIDNNISMQGKIICNYEIYSYEQMKDSVDVVVVTPLKEIFNDVCACIYKNNANNVEVLPLFMYLESGLPIENCLFNFGTEM